MASFRPWLLPFSVFHEHRLVASPPSEDGTGAVSTHPLLPLREARANFTIWDEALWAFDDGELGESVGKNIPVPVKLVTKENVSEFLR